LLPLLAETIAEVVADALAVALTEVVPTVVATTVVAAETVPLLYAPVYPAAALVVQEVEIVVGMVLIAEDTVHGQSVMVMVSEAVAV